MKSGLYGLRKGHKNFALQKSAAETPGNAGSRLLKSKIKIEFLCSFLRPYKPDFIQRYHGGLF